MSFIVSRSASADSMAPSTLSTCSELDVCAHEPLRDPFCASSSLSSNSSFPTTSPFGSPPFRGVSSKTALFSLKECQLGLKNEDVVKSKYQLQPSSFILKAPRAIQKSPESAAKSYCFDQLQLDSESSTAPCPPLARASLCASRRGCGFCLSNGERKRECLSHRLRNPDTLVVECPQLRKFVCPLCKATGDDAHTQGYCPNNDRTVATVKHLKKMRSSAGRLAGGKNLRSAPQPSPASYLPAVDPSIIAIGPRGSMSSAQR